jgi:hypothetical protein
VREKFLLKIRIKNMSSNNLLVALDKVANILGVNYNEIYEGEYGSFATYIVKFKDRIRDATELLGYLAYSGDFDSSIALAVIYTENGDYETGYRYLKMNEDEMGEDCICNYLNGLYFENGWGGCEKNVELALMYYKYGVELHEHSESKARIEKINR